MEQLSKARLEFSLVAVCATILAGFAIWSAVSDNIHPAIAVVLVAIAAIQCLPLILWESQWRSKAAESVAVLSAVLTVASLVALGPIFFAPAALLAADGARRLSTGREVSSSGS